MNAQSQKRFGEALFDLLRDEDAYLTSGGRVNLRAFAAELEGFHYQTLRRAVVGSRPPSTQLVEECARILRVRPEYFLEYRFADIRPLLERAGVRGEPIPRLPDRQRPTAA